MKKMIGLLVVLCIGLWAIPNADKAEVIQQPTLETHSASIGGAVHGKPSLNLNGRQTLLWDQAATQYFTFCACQWDSVYPFEAELADNFELTDDATIDYVVWWGGYWGGTPTPPIDFWIKIYPDSGAGLGPKLNPIYTQRVPYTETLIDPGNNYYYYEAAIPPFAASAGVRYWIVFEPTLVFPPQWGNNCSTLWGDGQQAYQAFELLGTPKWTDATTVFGSPYESSFQLYGPAGPIVWDFETGWQDWTNTNGLTFPVAWGVQVSDLNGTSWICPDAGDSSLWIDSDAAGSGGILVEDTALSPLLIPNATMEWLKYGIAYNNLSTTSEYLEAGIKYFDGSVWTVAPLKTYAADFGPAYDSVDVSAYSGYDLVQIYFFYTDNAGWYWYGAIDNVSIDATIYLAEHDVGCSEVTSPPEGFVAPGDYDVIGRIENFGNNTETFDVTADVYDTTGGAWTQIFTATITLTDFPVAGDSLVNFGQVNFVADSYYYTEIYTLLGIDVDPSNDTSSVYSRTAGMLGDVVYELDAETPIGNNRLLGIEFDGTYFYVSGGDGAGNNFVAVLDTLGTVVWNIPQPTSSSWGWRDFAWDGSYAGPDRIDTLWASDESGLYKFGINLSAGTLDNYGTQAGPVLPCRALAWDGVDYWFFTANWDPIWKFDKSNPAIASVPGLGSTYGAAYDTDPVDGNLVWFHDQSGPTGCYVYQMEPVAMTFPGVEFPINYTITTGAIAGGLCFHEGFRGMDVLFALLQGTPDAIVGCFVRWDGAPGVEEQPHDGDLLVFGFAPNMANPMRGTSAISYTTIKAGKVALKVYDGAGRLVETLVNAAQPAGAKTVNWDVRNIPNGVYFLRLEAEGEVATQKMILVK
jgi:hypothetical protein